jgi:hypothetical protein
MWLFVGVTEAKQGVHILIGYNLVVVSIGVFVITQLADVAPL